MTKKPRAKQDEHGRWQKNHARQKAGLNKAILASAWGQMVIFSQYKALKINKLVVKVDPAGSSQECDPCGYTHPDNRLTQSEFVCLRCGHTDNADHNATQILKKRGVAYVISGKKTKVSKKTLRMKKRDSGTELAALATGLTDEGDAVRLSNVIDSQKHASLNLSDAAYH